MAQGAKRGLKALAALCLSSVLQACTADGQPASERAFFYYIVGFFETNGDLVEGSVTVLSDQRGKVVMASHEGNLTCTGESQVTDLPDFGIEIDTEGVARIECSDGSRFVATFWQTEPTGGLALAWDESGTRLRLVFDESKAVAAELLREERALWELKRWTEGDS